MVSPDSKKDNITVFSSIGTSASYDFNMVTALASKAILKKLVKEEIELDIEYKPLPNIAVLA